VGIARDYNNGEKYSKDPILDRTNVINTLWTGSGKIFIDKNGLDPSLAATGFVFAQGLLQGSPRISRMAQPSMD